MNRANLHELISRYESNLDLLYNEEHDELFKWRALKTWKDEWSKPDDSFHSFAERFSAAKKDFMLLTDNSRMHPSSGVLKLWEKESDTVEHLFIDVLFKDNVGDVEEVQNNMDRFLDSYEKLRQKYYPGNWSYKQDRHSASVYLAMNNPYFNYIFKSSEAHTMAKYLEFGLEIGSGGDFKLKNYYKLCDEIVDALKEHPSLLEKHFFRLDENCYKDESLHLLAFDLIYCCKGYNFYKDLTYAITGKIKKSTSKAAFLEKQEMLKSERLERIASLEREIVDLENRCEGTEDISLIGVTVSSEQYGEGVVVMQDFNRITVRFAEVSKAFVLDKKYKSRPRFENDEDIVEAFTNYARMQQEIQNRIKEIERIN